jgi:glycosyltransferase involved in cell wall biosynthesis
MRLAYVTAYNPLDIKKWSGTGYYIGQSLKNQSIPLEYVGPLQDRFVFGVMRKCKRHYYELFRKKYLRDPEPIILKSYANQVKRKLSQTNTDIVFSATTNPIAYFECKQPVVFWADATFAGLLDFYPQYSNLCEETIKNWHLMETLAIQKSRLAIYSSEWAAQTAIKYYNADPYKVKVVPFGANVDSSKTLEEIKVLIESRPVNLCKILLLGVDWIRKGGDVAFKVAKRLNELGLSTELTVVGCQPLVNEPLPEFVKPLGFISKSTNEGKEIISQLIAKSHFLILPSMADCTPIVLCEANSLGVPCLSTKVGGIPTIIKDDINGQLFDVDADISEYCKYILDLFVYYSEYKKLALSSFNEYQSRLNWSTSGRIVKNLLMDIIGY